ncbi:MAG TPA: hypothetical protein VH350_11815 [Candidatus Sulfotelmatobacter sp.]|jgi:hypothetical protein|nr:hypothetical protein [Candidatus Sulfotelmatobacter sp.]
MTYPNLTFALALSLGLALPALAQNSDRQNKNLDVRSSVGDLHVGSDADASKAGLPLYPGARVKKDDENNSPANLSVFTDAFGIKLVVAKYVSDDSPAKIVDFYRDKLKKYGKVLECHSQKHADDVSVNDDDNKDSKGSKELKCDENSGPVTELKVGTDDNQHIVGIEPRDGGKGSNFTLVYLYSRGKRGEI